MATGETFSRRYLCAALTRTLGRELPAKKTITHFFVHRKTWRARRRQQCFNHVLGMPSLATATERDCLLTANVRKFVFICNEHEELEGCHMYYETERDCWTSSGKLVGRDSAT